MDGLSSAVVVIGLVQVATQVITALGRYVSRVKGAESSGAKLLGQIKLISAAETAIERVVQDSSRSSRAPELQTLIDEWFEDNGPPMKCKTELKELLRWLEDQAKSNKYKRWEKRIGWPAKEDNDTDNDTSIRRIHALLSRNYIARNLVSECGQEDDSADTVIRDIAQRKATRDKHTESEGAKSELLSWLDGFDCTNKHESTLRLRRQTTGHWLFKEQLYVDWRKGSTKFVWLHGKAGAGKSVLASAVIDDISNGLADNETLAYFYCDFRNIRSTSAMEVLRSVTKQLLWNLKRDWLSSFSDLTSRKARGAGLPTDLGKLFDLLERAAKLHERPIIVVDALDECEDLPNLLNELVKLAHGHCRLFVTSRTIHIIQVAFAGLPSITLDDRVDEMRNNIRFHIKTELQSQSQLETLQQDLKDEIEGVLMKKADGMFQWVQCQLNRLNECCSPGDIQEVLDTPATFHETYDRVLRAIDKKLFGPRRAHRALTWLVTALEPLTLSHLAEAISINCDKPERDSINVLMDKTVIPDILGSLVTVNGDNITLSHFTVKEYLTSDSIAHSTYFVHLPTASLELATVSIFSLILFSDNHKITVEDENDPLCLYASYHGLRHLADCPSDHNESLVKHLLTLQNHISIHRVIYEHRQWLSRWMVVMPQLALYLIILFGNPTLLRRYLGCYPVRVTEEDNPLVFAALYSNIPRFQILLENGLDFDLEGPVLDALYVHKLSPLIAAARNKTPEYREQLVQLLLEKRCIIPRDAIGAILSYDIPPYDLGAPCEPAIIRIFLEHSADAKLLVTGDRSCLHLVIGTWWKPLDEQLEIVHMLLAAGCDTMALDDAGHSPLHLAIKTLSTELVQFLVQYGCKVPSDAILCAISHFQHLPDVAYGRLLRMLQLPCANGALSNAQDARGCNALHHLCHTSHSYNESLKGVVQLLVEHGCDINCRNDAGETPLHLVATSPKFNLLHDLDFFLAQGAEVPIDIVNYAVRSLQYFSQAEDAIAILSILFNKLHTSCRSQTTGGDNALHFLLKCHIDYEPPSSFGKDCLSQNLLEVARFLMENSYDVHAPGSSGETPLQLAIEHGYCPFARSILAQITEPYPIGHAIQYQGDSEGNGIVHRLCGRWDNQLEDKVKLLREAGYDFARDINRPNEKGLTPLCITLMHGRAIDDPATVAYLLDLGASFYHVNYLHLGNLEWASNLPWYHDATDAQERCLSRSQITFDHVILVHHLLQIADQGRLSSAVARSILDMAEYWACMKVARNNVRYTTLGEQIAFPMVSGNGECWTPRRLIFSCKPSDFLPRTRYTCARIRVPIRRTDVVFSVPIYLELSLHSFDLEPPSVSFDVWNEFTPALQEHGRQRLMVGELVPGDMLSVEFDLTNDYFTLEFFQIEVYYTLKPLTRATSRDL